MNSKNIINTAINTLGIISLTSLIGLGIGMLSGRIKFKMNIKKINKYLDYEKKRNKK